MSEGIKPPKAPPVQVTQVKIVDIDIPFGSLCKVAFSSIAAILLLAFAIAFGGFLIASLARLIIP